MKTPVSFALAALVLLAPGPLPGAQAEAQGRVVLEVVHGASLEGNVTGESPDREVAVYLPQSYGEEPGRRFPVLYLLHGFGGSHAEWLGPSRGRDGWGTLQGVMNRGIESGCIAEMIVVMPNERTNGGGSFYANSAATGNWEDFTAVELVEHVDGTYRTLARAASRGIAGHSMGGYGALVLGMKHPDVYQVVYAMNAGVLGWGGDLSIENPGFGKAAKVTAETRNPRSDFWVAAILCVGQTFSPNLDRPPYFADLPFDYVDGEFGTVERVHALWTEHMPVYMATQYADNLRQLRGIRFDSGRDDWFTHIPPTNLALSKELTRLGIEHVFEEYNGGHQDRMWGEEGRLATEVLPYFSRMLVVEEEER